MEIKGCSGACEQGRKPCVTPEACEQEDMDAYDKNVNMVLIPIFVFLITCCLYFIWSLFV